MGFFSKKSKADLISEIEELKIKLSQTKVNHILHLILSIFTAGLWIIIWIITSISVATQKSDIKSRMKKLYKEVESIDKKNSTQSSAGDNLDKLAKLSEMFEKGHLTEEEFLKKKKELL